MVDSISPDVINSPWTSVEALASALLRAWSIDTSSAWTPDNPACGQCGVTSMVVQDLFGGEILKTGTPGGMHFYNRVNGVRIDLTQAQFTQLPTYEDLIPSVDDRNRLRRCDFGFRRGENHSRTHRSGADFRRGPGSKSARSFGWAGHPSPTVSQSSTDAKASLCGLLLVG